MTNLFDSLKSSLPPVKAREKDDSVDKQVPQTLDTDTLITKWQAKPDDRALTSEVLKRLQPTIKSAINSYAPGMDRQLSVKAARLTLDALKSYDSKRGVAAATYVFHNLKRLNRLGARTQNIIPQSEYAAAERKLVMSAMDRFIDDKNREPSMAELADATGLSVKKLESVLDQRKVINESATLSEDSKKDTIGASALTDDDYFEYVYTSVDPISQKIMEWTAGKHGAQQLDNNRIASKLHMSAAAVSQRKNKIQRMLSDARSLV